MVSTLEVLSCNRLPPAVTAILQPPDPAVLPATPVRWRQEQIRVQVGLFCALLPMRAEAMAGAHQAPAIVPPMAGRLWPAQRGQRPERVKWK